MAFEDEVKRALDELPPEFAKGLRNVAILIEDERPGSPGLLGLYQGVPLPQRPFGRSDPARHDNYLPSPARAHLP